MHQRIRCGCELSVTYQDSQCTKRSVISNLRGLPFDWQVITPKKYVTIYYDTPNGDLNARNLSFRTASQVRNNNFSTGCSVKEYSIFSGIISKRCEVSCVIPQHITSFYKHPPRKLPNVIRNRLPLNFNDLVTERICEQKRSKLVSNVFEGAILSVSFDDVKWNIHGNPISRKYLGIEIQQAGMEVSTLMLNRMHKTLNRIIDRIKCDESYAIFTKKKALYD